MPSVERATGSGQKVASELKRMGTDEEKQKWGKERKRGRSG
jgi:hypothetical protein